MILRINFKPAVLLVSCCLLSSCAALNDGLAQVNGALNSINEGLSSSATINEKNIPDKEASSYSLKNLKLSEKRDDLKRTFILTGEAFNKTSSNITVTISIPVYDSKGYYSHPFIGEVHVPAREKTRVDLNDSSPLSENLRVDTSKITFSVRKY